MLERKRDIRILVLDVDGTLTDGKIYMGNNGEMMKAFDVKDGCAIHDILPTIKHFDGTYGIIPIIITARESDIVKNRGKELNINHIYQGFKDKAKKLIEVVEELGYKLDENGIYSNVAYIGDDIIDIPSMELCAITACPLDAVKEVKDISDFISSKNGGNGAVREIIEWLRN